MQIDYKKLFSILGIFLFCWAMFILVVYGTTELFIFLLG